MPQRHVVSINTLHEGYLAKEQFFLTGYMLFVLWASPLSSSADRRRHVPDFHLSGGGSCFDAGGRRRCLSRC